MSRILSLLLTMGLAVVMTGSKEGNANDRVVITQAKNGDVVSVSRGDDIEVVLAGNPTTGYQWEVAGANESLLSSVGSSYTRDSDVVGAGGIYRFQFKAIATGEVRLRIVYRRPWETAVAEIFEVTIKIS